MTTTTRPRAVPTPHDDRSHLDRQNYAEPLEALRDVARVLADLEHLADGRTVVSVDEYAFLTRRALSLTVASIRAHEAAR